MSHFGCQFDDRYNIQKALGAQIGECVCVWWGGGVTLGYPESLGLGKQSVNSAAVNLLPRRYV